MSFDATINIVSALSGELGSAFPSATAEVIAPNADGLYPLDIKVTCNTNGTITRQHVASAVRRGLQEITPIPTVKGTHVILCGGGPSVKNFTDEIKRGQDLGVHVFGLNGATQFLNANGIVPDHQVVIDPRPDNVKLIGDARQYLIASQCAPEMLDEVCSRGVPVFLFHCAGSALDVVSGTCIGGSITVGLTAICLAFTMGYENIHLYGYDSSHAEGEDGHHAYPQSQTEQESRLLDVKTYDEHGNVVGFMTNFAMAKQAELFPAIAKMITDANANIFVHGDGLLPTIARAMARPAPLGAQAAE